MLKNYSLDDGKNTLRKSKGKNVTFGPTKSMDDRFLGQQTKPNGMLPSRSKFMCKCLNILSTSHVPKAALLMDVYAN